MPRDLLARDEAQERISESFGRVGSRMRCSELRALSTTQALLRPQALDWRSPRVAAQRDDALVRVGRMGI